MKNSFSTKKVLVLSVMLFFSALFTQAAIITSTATGGPWSTISTWVGGIAPTTGDAVVIATTGTSTVTVGTSTACASLTVNSGSTLSIGSRTLTVSGIVSNAGTITFTSGRITQSGTGDFTNSGRITFTSSGRLYITGSLTNTGTLTLASARLIFTGTNSGASTVAGFTTTGSVTFQRTAGSVTFSGNVKAGALTVSGSGGTLNLGAGLTHTFTGAVTITTGTLNGGSSNLNANLLSSVWSYNGGTFTAGTGTVNFGGAGTQQIIGTLTTTFNNLTLSGSGLKTLSKVPIVNGILSMEGTATISVAATLGTASTIQYKGTGSRTIGVEFPNAFAGTGGVIIDQGVGNTVTLNASKTALAGDLNIKSGTFDLTTFTFNRASSAGTLTIAADASLKIRGTNTLPSNYLAHSIAGTSTIEYAGTSQTVANLNSSQTYGNLTLSGSGTKTLQTGTTTIAGNLTISGTSSVTGVVGLTIGGNVDLQTGSTFVAGAYSHNIGGNWSNIGTFVNTGSTINFNGANAGNIGTGSFNNVTFSGSGVKTATGALTIAGNLIISNNFTAGSYSHSISGNWTNNGSFTGETSTVSFTSSSAQALGGTSSTTFNNLTMNGAGGVTLGIGSTVSGTLTFTSGKLTLGTYSMTAGTISGGSATSYVKTDNTGVLTRSVTTGSSVTFPVGNSSYNPITLTNTTTGNTDNYNVRIIDEALSNANSTKTVNRKWQITEGEAGGSALTVAATYNTADGTGIGFDRTSSPVFGYFNGSIWPAAIVATPSGSDPYTYTSGSGAITSDDLTSTSGFLSLGSGDAFSASKLVIKSISPAVPYTGQANVTVTVQSQNSNSVPTNVLASTNFTLSAGSTTLSGTNTGTISANTNETSLSNLKLTGTTTIATVTATRTSGDVLTAGTSASFPVVTGNIYELSETGNLNNVTWKLSTDGGTNWGAAAALPSFTLGSSDALFIPSGLTLTVDVSASFYNMKVEGILIYSSGTLTLNHTDGGGDYGLQVFGTMQNSGGTFTNSNTAYPVIIQGGTYIHATNGGSIPVATWNSSSSCQITGITSTAITSGLNQSFQNFTWDNASQEVAQTLSANLSVSGALTLTYGVITTSTYRVIVSSTGSVSSTNNARINGNLRRFVPNALTPTIDFPIGDASNYTPLSVTFVGTTAGSGYLDATTTVASPPLASGLSQTKYINRNWTLINTGVSGFTSYSSIFTFVNVDKTGDPNTSALVVRKLTGTTWSTTTNGTREANSTQCTGLTAFSTFVIGESNCSETNAVWFGGTSTDWNTGSNWCSGAVPTSTVDVDIPAGTTYQPVIGSAAACKNVTVETGASLTISGSNTLSVYGNWLLSGTFTPGSGTVSFTGSSAQTITGVTAFSNLTVNNAASVTAANNITVTGVLYLQSDQASTTKGVLDMGSNVLSMGVSATTTGTGDVTGTITRTHSFVTNTGYSFGNANTFIEFATVSGQTLPSSISVNATIGTAPTWASGTIKRLYEIIQTGGSNTSALIRLHYKDNEYSSTESRLSIWNQINSSVVVEIGKSNQDVTNNFITIQDVDFTDINTTMGYYQLAIAPTTATILNWLGATADWNTASNWDPQFVPSTEYGILIPDASTTNNDPILPAGADSCISLVIEAGGILSTASGANLVLTGTDAVWTKAATGTFTAGNSTVTVASTADFASFIGSTDFYNVTVADGAKLRPAGGSYIGITGTLSLSSTGILDAATNDNTIEFKGAGQSIPNPNGSTPGYRNLTISNTGTKTFPAVLNISGNYTNNGTVDALTNSSTVIMNGSLAQTLGGSTSTTFNNLTINNAAGVTAGKDITVNGILNLSSANPSATQGALEMVTNWGTYPGTTNADPGINGITTYYSLNMGATATTSGIGDVTGIVKRATILANTAYSFGNQYTTVSLTDGTMPNAITVTIKIGTAVPGKTGAVKRHYEIVPLTSGNDGFSTTSKVSANFHYLDSELNGNTESKLITGDYDIGGGVSSPDEHGRANYDFINNYVGLSNVPFSYFLKTTTGHDWRTIFLLSDYVVSYKVWNGSASNSWTTEANWTPSGIPQEGSFVIIPNALTTSNDPVLPATATINTLTIEAGGVLTMGSNTLIIKNSMSAGWEDQNVPGNDPGTSKVIFAKPGATVSGNARFYDVEIADTAYVTLGPASNMVIGNTITRTGSSNGKFYADLYDGSVEYNKDGGQTVIKPDGTTHYHNLILSGSGAKTLPTSDMVLHGNFTLSGTATTAPTNALSIGGELNIGSGTGFTAGSPAHTLSGNFTNNGTFTSTGSTITLDGTAIQTIGGSVASTFNNLTINNSNGITLDNSETVSGTLTLTSGLITSGSNTLTASGTISGASSSSYIDGKLTEVYSGTGSKTFPIGKGGNYRPVTLEYTALTGTSTVTAEQIEDVIPGTAPASTSVFASRYWSISESGGSGLSYTLKLDGTGWSPSHTVQMIKGDGSTNTAYATTSPNYTNSSVFTSFSNFGLGEEITSTSWNGSAWSNSDPTSLSDAVLDGNYSGAGFTCRHLAINAGRQVTISSGTLSVAGNLTLKSDASGTATLIDNGGTVSISGTANVEQYLTGTGGGTGSGRGWYIASPVNNATRDLFGSNYTAWKWVENNNAYSTISNLSATALDPAQGYVVRSGSSGNVTFSGGVLNTGTFNKTGLTRTGTSNATRGFHLMGNPYPSYLDWSAVTKTNMLTTIWYYTTISGSTMSYETYNSTSNIGTNINGGGAVTKYVPPMQAVWVRVDIDGNAGSLGFTNEMRSHLSGTNPLRSGETSQQSVLRLQVSNGTNNDEAIVLVNENASDDYDMFDSPKMANNNTSIPEIYTFAGSEKVVINGLNNISPVKELLLGFKTGKAGSFTIQATEIKNFDSDSQIFLKDNLLGKQQNLLLEPTYSFSSAIANSSDRFTLIMAKTPTDITNMIVEQSIKIYQSDNNQLNVLLDGFTHWEGNITVYNTLGQRIMFSQTTGKTTVLKTELPPGIYLVSVNAGSIQSTQKVVINNK